MKNPLVLRAHHMLCLQNFRGKGYSPAFTERMKAAAGLVAQYPQTQLILCVGPDCLCQACPNRIGAQCRSDPKPSQYDRAVLALCGWQTGQRLIWKQAQEQVRKRIFQAGKLSFVCGDCQWVSLCVQCVENSVENVENLGGKY